MRRAGVAHHRSAAQGGLLSSQLSAFGFQPGRSAVIVVPWSSVEGGHDIRRAQELLGHSDVSTTMMYLHVLNRGGLDVRSPFDRL